MTGRVHDISESGVGISVPFRLAPGSIVRLILHDSVLHGFVSHSTPDGDTFRIGIEVIQVLIGESDLSHLLKATLADTAPAAIRVEMPFLK